MQVQVLRNALMVVREIAEKIGLFSCDECDKEFETALYKRVKDLHFCSASCVCRARCPGGLIANKTARTNVDRYGVVNPFMSQEVKAKITETLLERYGVEHPLQSAQLREKFRRTCVERLGVEYPGQSLDVRRKASMTCIEKHGVDHLFKDQAYKQKRKETMLERHGVECSLQLKSARDAGRSLSANAKRHNTMKLSGTYALKQSRTENLCYDVLREIYGDDDVQRHVDVNGWDIDLYVRSLNAYVQIDGVYWHGLDRPVETIMEFKKPRDRVIYGTILRDQRQREWFEQNGKRLVRFTDKEVKQWQDEKRLRERLLTRVSSQPLQT